MSAAFLHGIEFIESDVGPQPVTVVVSAVIGLIGTAPSWAVTSPAVAPATNVASLVSSKYDAPNFGPKIQGYSIPYAIDEIQAQGAGQIIVVNVFDPTIHKTHVSSMALTVPASGPKVVNLGHMGINASSLHLNPAASLPDWPGATDAVALGALIKPTVANAGELVFKCTTAGTTSGTEPVAWNQTVGGTVTDGSVVWTNIGADAYVAGADYALDAINGAVAPMGSAISAGEALTASFDYADPSQVMDSDIIGTGFAGLQALYNSYSLFGFLPKLLIAPGFSQNTDVQAALATVASKLRSIYYIDCPAGTDRATMISNRGESDNAFNIADTRGVLVGPQEEFFDDGLVPTGVTISPSGSPIPQAFNATSVGPYSTWVAGAQAAKDLSNGYWWSGSNTEVVGIDGPDVPLYMNPNDPDDDTNLLNAAGIVTVFIGFGTGLRVWGNRSSAYPSLTTPEQFINIRRTLDVIEDSVQLAMLKYIDNPISNGLITSILADSNAFIRSLIQRGALVTGSAATYDPAANPVAQIAAGQLVFNIDCIPPPPLERLTFQVSIDTNLLANIGSTSASTQT